GQTAMSIAALFGRYRKLVREFRAANAANVTVTFALSTLPLVGFVGAAVDYSHANSVKAAMQAPSDSPALMLSKIASGMTQSEVQTKVTAYFTALFTRPEATSVQVTATYSTSGGNQILLASTANVQTSFMGIVGKSQMQIGVNSQIKWGNSRLRVA